MTRLCRIRSSEKRFRRSGPAGTSAYADRCPGRRNEAERKKGMKKIELDSIAIPQALDLAVEKGIQKGKQELRKRKERKSFSVLAAAAVLLVFAGYCGANPAFAKDLPLIGGIFQELQDKSRLPETGPRMGKSQ